MPFNMKPWEFLIIVALILLLFGAKRLPDAARGLGRSLRIFKAETKALHDDDGAETTPDTQAAAKPAPEAITPTTTPSGTSSEASSTPQAERTET